ncbi:MAG TPA: primosomal protein N' [Bacteroidetes bacterium]|nr:primosomal protein N' [Bacteroidota bacterium]
MSSKIRIISPALCEVVFPLPIRHGFTYQIPPHLRPILKPGYRVLVPFGRRKLTGFVTGLPAQTKITELKEVEDILDDKPIVTPEILKLTKWIAEYYMASWGEVIEAALPAGINLESRKKVALSGELDREKILALEKINKDQRNLLLLLHRKGKQVVSQLESSLGKQNLNYNLMILQKRGLLFFSRELIEPKTKIKFQNFVRLSSGIEPQGELEKTVARLMKSNLRQADLVMELAKHPAGMLQTELLRCTKTSSSTLKKARENGLIDITRKETFRDYYGQFEAKKPELLTLNADQEQALQKLIGYIDERQFIPVLLYGVTGSGKTQVYIDVLKEVRKKNRNAIVLVPEIALTPQTVSRFKAHFGDDIAVLHSRMSNGERYDSWRKIHNGQVHIVIGPRSAIFAPLANIGLIVVDEEQENSYKQNDQSPRYHARDVALIRGQMNRAIVILGSATPSLESYYNARIHKFKILEMPHRVEALPLPEVEIVDMREEWQKYKGKPSLIFSHRLMQKIAEKLDQKEQVILLQNRRGFSTFILCRDCGHVERCINCNITLTYHIHEHRLRCHYCDYQKAAPQTCPSCGGIQINYKGTGTQRVEEEIRTHFPAARVVRMDMDTTRRKGSHDRILRDFEEGEYDILLGTQMVAKGLDFPNVTLVGVISADTTLRLPDFRAAERTFQLLTQVAGRSGRKTKQGEVIIQTYSPQDHSIIFSKKHDYLRFFAGEIMERKDLSYPPFSRLIKIEFRESGEEKVKLVADVFARNMIAQPFYRLLGPAPAPLSRLKDEYRYHIIIKYNRSTDPQGKKTRDEIQRVSRKLGKKGSQGVKIIVDVDPTDLF